MTKKVLYFSAEWGLAKIDIPIYAGGLGVLAGDTLNEADRMHLPWVGMGLLYREGFFRQKLNERGEQQEEPYYFDPLSYGLAVVRQKGSKAPLLLSVPFPGRQVYLQVWELRLHHTPLYLLDAKVPENSPEDKKLTARLYTGDWNLHLAAEVLLGVGGAEAARALNLGIDLWHLNDDHATFSLLWRLKDCPACLENQLGFESACQTIRDATVFTTHTPIKGAESAFAKETVAPYLQALFGEALAAKMYTLGEFQTSDNREKLFSLSVVAMRLSRARNAVSLRHNMVAKKIWHFIWPQTAEGKVPIRAVTNGVNPYLWTYPSLDHLYHRYLDPLWLDRVDEVSLWQRALTIPSEELWSARLAAKQALLQYLRPRQHWRQDPPRNALFVGFARRFAAYKQPGVLINDPVHLKALLLDTERPTYLFLSGKANFIDPVGKALVKKAWEMCHDPVFGEHIVFLEDYGLTTAQYLTAGVDLWINTPQPPWEACGTSGMKAIYNGVLNASTFDGWWYEAYGADLGWVVGPQTEEQAAQLTEQQTSDALFYLLEQEIVPLYFQRDANGVPRAWLEKVKTALSKLGPRFNTRRMLREYQAKIYA
jgi:starch phosphorylase